MYISPSLTRISYGEFLYFLPTSKYTIAVSPTTYVLHVLEARYTITALDAQKMRKANEPLANNAGRVDEPISHE